MRDINIHGVYIQVWGNDTKGGNGFTQIINSYLFGTASGHASITLIIPANEEGCSLIQKYCDNKETDSCSGQNAIIPYDKFSILLPSGDVKEVFQVRFSWWNDENAPFYLSPSLEIEAAQLNRKKSFNWKENFLSYIDPEPDLLVGISGETHILKGPERIDILPIDDTLKEILVLDREIYLLNNKIMIIQSVIESINKQEIGNVRIRRKEKVQINRIFKDEIISDINLSRENAEILGKNLSDKMNELLLSRDEKQEKKDTSISNIPSLKEEVDKHNNMLDKLAFIENMYNEVRDKIIKNDFSSDKNFQYAYIWHFLDSEGYLGEYYEKIYDNEAFKKLEKYLQVAIKDQLKKINLQRIKCANLSLFKEKNDITGVSRYQGFMVENEVFLPSNVNSINGVSRESINIENMLKAMREIVDNKKFDAAEYNCSSVVCNILEAGFPEDLKPIAQERMLSAFLTPSLIYNIAREARQYYIDSEYKPKKRLIISPIARITIKIAQIIFDNKQNLFIRVFFGLIALTLLLFKGVYEYIKQVLSNPIGYIEATIDVFILLKEKKHTR